MAFCPRSEFLAVSSDSDTVHVFKLEAAGNPEESNPSNSPPSEKRRSMITKLYVCFL